MNVRSVEKSGNVESEKNSRRIDMVLVRRLEVLGFGLFVLAVGVVFLVRPGAGAYNVASQITWDNANGSNYPKCDNGENFFTTMFIEWMGPQGRMVAGQSCNIGALSKEAAALRTEQELIDEGIDPATATESQVGAAHTRALIKWASEVLSRSGTK
jgi:hypothetical protein